MFDFLRRFWGQAHVLEQGVNALNSSKGVMRTEAQWYVFLSATPNYRCAYPVLEDASERLKNWLDSVSYSGYTREKALRWLIENYQRGDENRILLRLSDWVPEVQVLAEQWLLARFHELSLRELEPSLQVLCFLLRKEALAQNPALLNIQSQLIAKIEADSERQFAAYSQPFRRFLLALSLNQSARDIARALNDCDPINRAEVFGRRDLSLEVIQQTLSDPSSQVRRRALNHVLTEKVSLSKEQWLRLAFDSCQSIRKTAAFYLKRDFAFCVQEAYFNATGEARYYLADQPELRFKEIYFDGLFKEQVRVRIQAVCLRALLQCCPEELLSSDCTQLLVRSNQLRVLLWPFLAKHLSRSAYLGLLECIDPSKNRQLLPYLDTLAQVSYWDFISLSLARLETKENKALEALFYNVFARQRVYRPLPPAEKLGNLLKVQLAQNYPFCNALFDEALRAVKKDL